MADEGGLGAVAAQTGAGRHAPEDSGAVNQGDRADGCRATVDPGDQVVFPVICAVTAAKVSLTRRSASSKPETVEVVLGDRSNHADPHAPVDVHVRTGEGGDTAGDLGRSRHQPGRHGSNRAHLTTSDLRRGALEPLNQLPLQDRGHGPL